MEAKQKLKSQSGRGDQPEHFSHNTEAPTRDNKLDNGQIDIR